ncbi:hypothetical protein FY036_06945 [Mesorhizobium microcysteis]|uniref:Uncharacterized protein n=1 Tax=Neoaquamicrobium microcysteis TaxID=2682781 RepID=A0A5D4H176_9HYPH|nr:hypothetical protein [Mesorhizobium microcysteis]TYR33779.1 hypothetical protein FY036_06945 [Mesorhizobium microcysteis]
MHKILITSLSVYWTVVFALAASGAGTLSAAGLEQAGLGDATLAIANALVAALFLWTAIATWARVPGAPSGGYDDVARVAFTAASLVLSAAALVEGLGGEQVSPMIGIKFAALAASYLVIRMEERAGEQEPAVVDYSYAVARRLAVGAAHGSMLSRLTRRGPDTAENEG